MSKPFNLHFPYESLTVALLVWKTLVGRSVLEVEAEVLRI